MKFKWLIIHEDYTLHGTNDDKVAEEAQRYAQVYNCETGQQDQYEEDSENIVWVDVKEYAPEPEEEQENDSAPGSPSYEG